MSFYTPFISLLINQLKDKGFEVSVKQSSNKYHDPVTGFSTDEQSQIITVLAYPSDYSLKDSGLKNDDETLIKIGDKKVLTASKDTNLNDFLPTLTDVITINAVKYRVKNIKVLGPIAEPIGYELQCRI